MAFPIIQKHEGYYANHPNDKGGETYAGIARNYNKGWYGWFLIDKEKLKRKLKVNERLPALDQYVKLFYSTWWDTLSLSVIKDQNVANFVFDFIVNSSSTGVKYVEETLSKVFGSSIKADRKFEAETIFEINRFDPDKLFVSLKNSRLSLIDTLVKADPTQQVFRKNWTDRVVNFPKVYSGFSLVMVALFLIATFFLCR